MSKNDLFDIEELIPIQSGLNITQDEHKFEQKSSFDDTSIKTENI